MDFPYSHPTIELMKLEQLGLEGPVLRGVLAGNFERLLASV